MMSQSIIKRAGVITTVASAPVLLGGFILMIASITAPAYTYAIGPYGYPQSTPNDNSALGAANAVVNIVGALAFLTGVVLMGSSHSHVRVNGVVF